MLNEMKITLSCGIDVYVEAFHMYDAYSGVVVGRPPPSYKLKLISRAVERVEKMWGHPVHLITPPVVDSGVSESGWEYEWLPPMNNCVKLKSFWKKDPELFQSLLAVIWFSPRDFDKSLHDRIEEGIRDVDWQNLAKDVDCD